MKLPDLATLTSIKNDAEKALRFIGEFIHTEIKPPPGPYAFFYHNGHAIERLNDCHRTLERLFDSRKFLSETAPIRTSVLHNLKRWGKIPLIYRPIFRQTDKVVEYMKQDIEALYIFAWIMLDQWALQVFYINGIKNPEKSYKYPFRNLVEELDTEPPDRLTPLWHKHHEEMLWLDYNIRFYRNRFIVHADKPWQRSKTMSVFGDTFQISSITPVGWLDSDKLNEEIRNLRYLAPDHDMGQPRQFLKKLFSSIGKITKRIDREIIIGLIGKMGDSTPTFQIIADRLYKFISKASTTLVEITKNNFDIVNLGRSSEIEK